MLCSPWNEKVIMLRGVERAMKQRRLASRLRVIVLGYIVRGPLGGLAWHHLQYILGLTRLGHDVYFFEDSDDYPSCYDPRTNSLGDDPGYGMEFASHIFEAVGLSWRWAYYDAHTASWFGPAADGALAVCASADILLNISGVNPIREWYERIPTRVLIDTDPLFVQVRHLQNVQAKQRASQHNAFLSFGENVGGTATLPDDGFAWHPTRQPIVLECWPFTNGPKQGRFTTVMQWESYAPVEYGGKIYGMKSMSFGPYRDLPRRTETSFELAIGNPPAELERCGWGVRNPLEVTRDPWTYQSFIMESKAEFSVAKHGYVVSRSGWFSERSACYLASGRPVLVQDTGFSEWLPPGRGVIAFEIPDQALEGIKEINSRYEFHCRSARDIAEAYFDSGKVLNQLLNSVQA
jgi:hypothetical protein